jgi:hypothetical protein
MRRLRRLRRTPTLLFRSEAGACRSYRFSSSFSSLPSKKEGATPSTHATQCRSVAVNLNIVARRDYDAGRRIGSTHRLHTERALLPVTPEIYSELSPSQSRSTNHWKPKQRM